MQTIEVDTPGGKYPIYIANGAFTQIADSVPGDATSLVIVTNTTVASLYKEKLVNALATIDKPIHIIELDDGEQYKNWDSLNKIFDYMLTHALDRKAVMLALGGGVVGDICGFAAASYMRGVRFIQIPTTLLAQVDSSVGGKTAINHPLGKNMIGAFYQPLAVIIDLDVLQTLAQREISAGLAEVIKYGMIADAEFFAWCESNASNLLNLDETAIKHAIKKSCEIKAFVVSQDERESGLRAILNLGHTFGHAIESGMGYGNWLHGEAVGCGMIMAAKLSNQVFGLDQDVVHRIYSLVKSINCPVEPPSFTAQKWLDLMRIDKKNTGQKIRYILLEALGQAKITTVADDAVKAMLQS